MKPNNVHRNPPANAIGLEQVLALLRTEVEREGSMRKWAAKHSVSVTLVSDTLNKKITPAAAVLDVLQLDRLTETYYVPR